MSPSLELALVVGAVLIGAYLILGKPQSVPLTQSAAAAAAASVGALPPGYL